MKPSGKKAAVLLAAYNGQAFLRDQLQSILQQSCPPELILVRDDGSSDKTTEIVESFQRKYGQRLQLIRGSNVGFVANFWLLIRTVAPEFNYYFFADQDDIWRPDKIERAIGKIKDTPDGGSEPWLYFSRLHLVDSTLKTLGFSPLPGKWGLGNALFENPVTGCTAAFNKPFLNLLRDHPPRPERLVAHDWWCYLVASALGQICYDPEPTILYRQHGANSMGGQASRMLTVLRRLQGFARGTWSKRRPEPMVAEFYRVFSSRLSPEQKELIRTASARADGFWKAFRLWRQGLIWRTKALDQGVLLVLLLRRSDGSFHDHTRP
jgi:glycosyltransferase involved in cell wall biosynthesis